MRMGAAGICGLHLIRPKDRGRLRDEDWRGNPEQTQQKMEAGRRHVSGVERQWQ